PKRPKTVRQQRRAHDLEEHHQSPHPAPLPPPPPPPPPPTILSNLSSDNMISEINRICATDLRQNLLKEIRVGTHLKKVDFNLNDSTDTSNTITNDKQSNGYNIK